MMRRDSGTWQSKYETVDEARHKNTGKLIGGMVLVVLGIISLCGFTDDVALKIVLFVGGVVGAYLFVSSYFYDSYLKKVEKLLDLLSEDESYSITNLAIASGMTEQKAMTEVQKMIDKRLLTGCRLDKTRKQLIWMN